jgi:hypothetical protein
LACVNSVFHIQHLIEEHQRCEKAFRYIFTIFIFSNVTVKRDSKSKEVVWGRSRDQKIKKNKLRWRENGKLGEG